MTLVRPAQVRFYVDADLLGLGHALAALRNDVTYPGDPGKVIHNGPGQHAPSSRGRSTRTGFPLWQARGGSSSLGIETSKTFPARLLP